MAEKRDSGSDDYDVDDNEFTDTDLFDPEAIAQELEAMAIPQKRAAGTARAAIEEMMERKRLQRMIREFDEDDDELDPNWL